MGGKINKEIFTDYKGKRIYFCCAPCMDDFKKAPDKYMKVLADKGEAAEDAPAKHE